MYTSTKITFEFQIEFVCQKLFYYWNKRITWLMQRQGISIYVYFDNIQHFKLFCLARIYFFLCFFTFTLPIYEQMNFQLENPLHIGIFHVNKMKKASIFKLTMKES